MNTLRRFTFFMREATILRTNLAIPRFRAVAAKNLLIRPLRQRAYFAILVILSLIVPAAASNSQGLPIQRSRASDHWAFKPPKLPSIPRVKNTWWVRNPIDAFILAKLESKGLKPPSNAEKHTLIRRVYLDLIGLPPSPQEQSAFLQDKAPNAYEKLVDSLLARPEYGERWARHWLDVARYADTNGYERDGNKPNAWRYRDYVINALNSDKPYDRFVVEQIAGDEVEDSNSETQIATTFLRLGTWDDEPAEPMVDRYDQLDDVLGTTAAVFMAQTIRCARCHDHKFEPFSQKDYYRLLSVFAPLKRPQKERDDLDMPVGTEPLLKECREAHAKIDPIADPLRNEIALIEQNIIVHAMDAKRVSLANGVAAAIRAAPSSRDVNQKDLVSRHQLDFAKLVQKEASDADRKKLADLVGQLQVALRGLPPEPPHAYIWREDTLGYAPIRVLLRGDPNNEGEEVHIGIPDILSKAPPGEPVPSAHSTGRRLWLAKWLTSPQNPIAARVIVNRIWQHHFGNGIVSTPNDFGIMGQRPTHPELLDWLSMNFTSPSPEMQKYGSAAACSTPSHPRTSTRPWSMKALHRLIVTSSTYRASSIAMPDALRLDPDNRLLSRWPMRRLEAEAVRDSLLSVSGQLNSERGGPGVYPPLPRSVLEGQSVPGQSWYTSDDRQASRRSIYVFVKRSLCVPELEVLDSPDTTSSCEARTVSTVAPQALTFLNGEFAQKQARHVASRLRAEAGGKVTNQIALAYKVALCRRPSADESKAGLNFLMGNGSLDAYCLVILNTNEFAYVN